MICDVEELQGIAEAFSLRDDKILESKVNKCAKLQCFMEVLLDANFVVSCVKKKIDFVSELETLGFKVLLPKEVFEEIKDLKNNSDPATRVAVNVALEMFSKRKIKNVALGKKPVDLGLIEFGRNGAYIATLDTQIKRQVPNRVVISESGNKLVIERS